MAEPDAVPTTNQPRDEAGRYAPAEPTAPEPAEAPAAAEEAPPPPWEGKSVEDLWKLNGTLIEENRRYKERFRPWETAAGNLHEQDAAFFQGFLGALATDDRAALAEYAPVLRSFLDSLTPAQQRQVAEAVAQGEEQQQDWDLLDPVQARRYREQLESEADRRAQARVDERLAEWQNEQQRQADIADAQRRFQERAEALADTHSFPPFKDPNSRYGRLLYVTAANEFGDLGDPLAQLDAAAEAIVNDLHEQAQALLKAKAADATPPPAPSDGGTPAGRQPPKDLAAARAAAEERVRLASLAQPGQ